MNRRNFLQTLAAVSVIAAAGTASAAPHRPLRPGWQAIDRRKISAATESVSFVHRTGIDPVGAFRIMAKSRAIWLNSVTITYRGGATQVHKFDINIPPGSSSPSLVLAYDSNMLRRIDISLNSLPPNGGEGELLVWGESAVDPMHTATE